MAKYIVEKGSFIELKNKKYKPGDEIQLTEKEAETFGASVREVAPSAEQEERDAID